MGSKIEVKGFSTSGFRKSTPFGLILSKKIYFSEFNEFSQDAYTIVDLNLIWESADETMRSRFFIKNATDEDYIAGYISAATGGGRFGQWGYPRTAGIEIQRNF